MQAGHDPASRGVEPARETTNRADPHTSWAAFDSPRPRIGESHILSFGLAIRIGQLGPAPYTSATGRLPPLVSRPELHRRKLHPLVARPEPRREDCAHHETLAMDTRLRRVWNLTVTLARLAINRFRTTRRAAPFPKVRLRPRIPMRA